MDFSARCQGPGYKVDLLTELMHREAGKGINPDPLIDAYMKVSVYFPNGVKGFTCCCLKCNWWAEMECAWLAFLA